MKVENRSKAKPKFDPPFTEITITLSLAEAICVLEAMGRQSDFQVSADYPEVVKSGTSSHVYHLLNHEISDSFLKSIRRPL